MPMKELGARIQAAREGKGLSIVDVALKLKVHRATLTAIENGNLDDMPEPVYARSFTRSYAQMMGIDQESVLHVMDEVFPLEKTPEYTEKHELSKPFKPRRASSGHGWIALVVIILLIVAAGWYYMTYMRTPAAPVEASAQSAPAEPANQAVPAMDANLNDESTPDAETPAGEDAVSENAPASQAHTAADAAEASGAQAAAAPATASNTRTDTATAANTGDIPAPLRAGTLQTAPGATAAATGTTPVAPAEENTAAAPAETAAAARTPQSGQAAATAQSTPPSTTSTPQATVASRNGTNSLVVTAVDEAWFRINLDGRERQHLFKAGQSQTFTFTQKATLFLGNAGGVRLTYNGQQLPQPGARGEVRTMTFPPAS